MRVLTAAQAQAQAQAAAAHAMGQPVHAQMAGMGAGVPPPGMLCAPGAMPGAMGAGMPAFVCTGAPPGAMAVPGAIPGVPGMAALPDGIEKVDIIISEWMGTMLVFESMLDSVLVARYDVTHTHTHCHTHT